MRMMATRCVLCLAVVLSCLAPAFGDDAFLTAQGLYEQGDYQQALDIYETLESSGQGGPALYYNMGNAHLRLGELGPGVYFFQKAADLAPGDEDIAFNLAYAQSLMRDQQETQASPLHRAVFFLDGQVAPLVIELLFLVLAGGGWLCLALAPRFRLPALRQGAWILLFLTLLVAPSALYQQYEAHFVHRGVILPDELPVRAGLSEEATELFSLHAGSMVSIEDERDGYLRIRFGQDKIGWVPMAEVGIL